MDTKDAFLLGWIGGAVMCGVLNVLFSILSGAYLEYKKSRKGR